MPFKKLKKRLENAQKRLKMRKNRSKMLKFFN